MRWEMKGNEEKDHPHDEIQPRSNPVLRLRAVDAKNVVDPVNRSITAA
jgi:hypothetical protein